LPVKPKKRKPWKWADLNKQKPKTVKERCEAGESPLLFGIGTAREEHEVIVEGGRVKGFKRKSKEKKPQKDLW